MTLFRSPIVVLDTETTGFPGQAWSRVIELGAVLLDTDGTEVDAFGSLVLPDILDERAARALEINRITVEMLRGQPAAWSVAASFRGWLASREARWVAAYNIAFDRPMVERMGMTSLQWASCIMLRSMDMMGQACPTFDDGRRKWPSLAAAAAHFGVTVEGDAHRAVTDARTAARVAVAIRQRQLAGEAAA